MLFQQIKQHPLEYGLLGLILFTSFVFFNYFSFDPHSQRRIVYATAAAYLSWSVYHHYRRGDLTVSIVIEYLVFSLFALVLISSTLI